MEELPKEGILLVNKPRGKTSFSLIHALRKKTGIQKIGHTGTLDPFATGLMILLVGKAYTRLSDRFLHQDKEYLATIRLGIRTDSYDCDGQIIGRSDERPSEREIDAALTQFQGDIWQIPPMFSAKKVQGKKLYDLARKGKTIDRAAVQIRLKTEKIHYSYPFLSFAVECSKGTYIRSIAEDLGNILGCGGHLVELKRTRSGKFHLEEAIDGEILYSEEKQDLLPYLQQLANIEQLTIVPRDFCAAQKSNFR